jgi:5-methylcytosine-specific restriction endonuclease McrA
MIQENQRSDGDHIIEFCKGGTTSYDNLQILHKICHEQKNMKK